MFFCRITKKSILPVTYSHLKNFTLIILQITAINSIMITAPVTLSIGSPSAAFFSIFIPCVNGRTSTILCIAPGITSYGRVAPEKISIGKYNTLAITPAIFELFAIPPIIIPMLNIEIPVSSASLRYSILPVLPLHPDLL